MKHIEGTTVYVAGRNEGRWGLPLLSDEWGEDRVNVSRMAAVIANDLVAERMEAHMKRITDVRSALLAIRQHPADLNKAMSEIGIVVRTGEVIMLMASALVSLAPEIREAWLAHVQEEALIALGHAATQPVEESVDQG